MDKANIVIGIFDIEDNLQKSVSELELAGFDRRAISVLNLGTKDPKKFKLSATLKNLGNSNIPVEPNVAPEERGILQGVIIGATVLFSITAALLITEALLTPRVTQVATTWGLIGLVTGVILAKILQVIHNRAVERQIKKCGLVLWIAAGSKDKAVLARQILRKFKCSFLRQTHDTALKV